jgi:hypothetical protein
VPTVNVPVLSNRHRPCLPQGFDRAYALDNHPGPRGTRKPRDKRDRCGEDQRTGSRHHDDRERTLRSPLNPERAPKFAQLRVGEGLDEVLIERVQVGDVVVVRTGEVVPVDRTGLSRRGS